MANNLVESLSFQVYYNAQSLDLECNPKLFADDVSLNGHIKNTSWSTTCLSRYLDEIGLWGYQWNMLFNPDPAKSTNEVFIFKS